MGREAIRLEFCSLLQMIERGIDVIGKRVSESQEDVRFAELWRVQYAAGKRSNCGRRIGCLEMLQAFLKVRPRLYWNCLAEVGIFRHAGVSEILLQDHRVVVGHAVS